MAVVYTVGTAENPPPRMSGERGGVVFLSKPADRPEESDWDILSTDWVKAGVTAGFGNNRNCGGFRRVYEVCVVAGDLGPCQRNAGKSTQP